MWRSISLVAVVGASAALVVSSRLSETQTPEERDALHAREKAYEIIRKSILEYKRRVFEEEKQSFEEFLRTEWPQDFQHYTSGMRSYDEWKQMFDAIP